MSIDSFLTVRGLTFSRNIFMFSSVENCNVKKRTLALQIKLFLGSVDTPLSSRSSYFEFYLK